MTIKICDHIGFFTLQYQAIASTNFDLSVTFVEIHFGAISQEAPMNVVCNI